MKAQFSYLSKEELDNKNVYFTKKSRKKKSRMQKTLKIIIDLIRR